VHDELLTIGTFTRRSRLSRKALRLYEQLGLLVPAEVDDLNGYRRYRTSQLDAARLIVLLRRLDMPLPEVREVLRAPADDRGGLVQRYWAGVEQQVAFQRELASHLLITLSGQEGTRKMFEIEERETGEQFVLTEQSHVLAAELPAWIGQAMERLLAAAAEVGGATGPAFVIYHGEVTEDSDGPVEACLPIAAGSSTAAATRVEPAHREAFTRLRKAQVQYPQILSAFDATAQWVAERGLTASAAPREIYFADWPAAGPQDEVCDVAYPL
jgi:DNA-binding transcriptional MerR regulator